MAAGVGSYEEKGSRLSSRPVSVPTHGIWVPPPRTGPCHIPLLKTVPRKQILSSMNFLFYGLLQGVMTMGLKRNQDFVF